MKAAAVATLANEELSIPAVAAGIVPKLGTADNVYTLINEQQILQAEFCYQLLAPKWAARLGGFDVWTRGHCRTVVFQLSLEPM